MATLTIDEKKAKEIYPDAPAGLKTILEETFTKKLFMGKITERIKTFEDVCKESGENAGSSYYTVGEPDELAYRKLKLVARVLNNGWKPNWNNNSQYKWFPWFYMNTPGFRFNFSGCLYTAAYSAGGSRLCFSSSELSDFAGKTFLELYKQLMGYEEN